jgi:hypothetical protein
MQHHDDTVSAIEILSPKADLKEATTNLYAAMHRLDKLDLILLLPNISSTMNLEVQ